MHALLGANGAGKTHARQDAHRRHPPRRRHRRRQRRAGAHRLARARAPRRPRAGLPGPGAGAGPDRRPEPAPHAHADRRPRASWLDRMDLDGRPHRAGRATCRCRRCACSTSPGPSSYDPQLLLLDEITAALPSDLAERVFAVMREWRDRGRSVLFISHRLAEVTAVCDRATVLRDGRTVGTLVPQEGGEAQIVELMLGDDARRARRGARPRAARRPARAEAEAVRRAACSRSATCVVGDARRGHLASRCAPARSSASPRSRARARTQLFELPRRPAHAAERRDRRRRPARFTPAHPVRRDPRRRRARARRPRCWRCCRSARSARTSPRRCTTASRAGGRSTAATSAERVGDAVDRLSIDTRAPAPGAAAVGRQPAEADDRPLARRRLPR